MHHTGKYLRLISKKCLYKLTDTETSHAIWVLSADSDHKYLDGKIMSAALCQFCYKQRSGKSDKNVVFLFSIVLIWFSFLLPCATDTQLNEREVNMPALEDDSIKFWTQFIAINNQWLLQRFWSKAKCGCMMKIVTSIIMSSTSSRSRPLLNYTDLCVYFELYSNTELSSYLET